MLSNYTVKKLQQTRKHFNKNYVLVILLKRELTLLPDFPFFGAYLTFTATSSPSSPAVVKSNITQQELPLPGVEITTKEKEGVSQRPVLFIGLEGQKWCQHTLNTLYTLKFCIANRCSLFFTQQTTVYSHSASSKYLAKWDSSKLITKWFL